MLDRSPFASTKGYTYNKSPLHMDSHIEPPDPREGSFHIQLQSLNE